MALRERPELGIQPGGPLLRRIPAEPSPALAGRGSLLPGKQTGSAARARRAWAWGVLSARAPGTQHWAPVRWPLQPDLAERGALCPARPRRNRAWGLRGGRGRRGRGAGRRGHVTGLFTNTAGPAASRGGSRGGVGSWGSGPGPIRGTKQVWGVRFGRGNLETRSLLLP